MLLLDSGAGSSAGTIVGPSIDLGSGGMALAAFDLDEDGSPYEVLVAPTVDPVDTSAGRVGSTLSALRWSSGQWITLDSTPVGEPNSTTHDFAGYGACGIRVIDIDPESEDDELYIAVATVSGELVLFPWNRSSSQFGPPRWREIVDGSIGAFHSMVVADLVTSNGSKPEIYLAGEMGIRRFDVQ